MSYRCLVCLEGFPAESLIRLCAGCNDSRVCRECVGYAVENGFEDRLSNCMLCNRPTDFHYRPFLRPTYQILTLVFWWFMGLPVFSWKPVVVMHALYSCFRGLCSRQDRDSDNTPRTLILKWNVFMGMTHVPYYLFFILRRLVGSEVFWGYDDYLSEYVFAHGVIPALLCSVVWVYKTAKGNSGR